jgi:AcrR family transcriptional regulator
MGVQNPAMAREPTPPSEGRVERRKARTRAALLAAARALFASRGMEQTTIAEIAAHADVATGSFYNYFAGKEQLLESLLEPEFAKQRELISRRQEQVEDPAEKMSIAHRHLVLVGKSDPDWAWLILRLDVPYRAAWATLGPAASDDLNAGLEAGRFDVANPELALTAIGGALFAVIHEQLVGKGSAEADSQHAEGVLRSLGVPPGEAAEIARRPLPQLAAGPGS